MPVTKPSSTIQAVLPWLVVIIILIAGFNLFENQQQLHRTLAFNEAEADQIKVLSAEYESLAGVADKNTKTFIDADQAMKWLLEKSRQQGIKINTSAITNSKEQGSLAAALIEAKFESVQFNRLIQWLQQSRESNLNIVATSLKASEPGEISGFITFELR
jgi:type II secretory pathway component PulM